VVGKREIASVAIGAALVRTKVIGRRAKEWTDESVLSAIEKHCGTPKAPGLLILVDEMGKLLEGAAQDLGDVYFFQRIAELASRSEGRVVVVGILHQAFDEYSHRLSRETREEWAKIQGRWIDLALSASPDEQLKIIASAIEADKAIRPNRRAVDAVATALAVKKGASQKELSATLSQCAPLHPITAAILGPISRRRFGQNQRSVFGFLTSAEPYGFQEFLRSQAAGDEYTPDRLWDYLRANLEGAILTSPDAHRWSTAADAIERADRLQLTARHIAVLKCIAVLDLFRERSGIVASANVLASLDSHSVASILRDLSDASLIVFRKHTDAYAIFAGSDFDVQAAIDEIVKKAGEPDLETLHASVGLRPIVAKRHYHATGAHRWLDIAFVQGSQLQSQLVQPSASGAIGRVLVALPDKAMFGGRLHTSAVQVSAEHPAHVVIGVSDVAPRVRDLARELSAATSISTGRPELAGDAVARRELLARIALTQTALSESLQELLASMKWYRAGKSVGAGQASLSRVASDIADEKFCRSPIIQNELINRSEPSSNAVAGLKALLKQMISAPAQPYLGIEGFPPERGLYDSLLGRTGLHVAGDSGWHFSSPTEGSDPCRIAPAWNRAREIMSSARSTPVSAPEIFSVWDSEFGIKAGLHAWLLATMLCAHRSSLAVYRNGVFTSRLSDLDVDLLTGDPRSLAFRWIEDANESRAIREAVRESLALTITDSGEAIGSALQLARHLVGFYDNLPSWTRRTRRVSDISRSLCALLKTASDPNHLLYVQLPTLLIPQDAGSADAIHEVFRDRLTAVLEELGGAFPALIDDFRGLIFRELGIKSRTVSGTLELVERASSVVGITGDYRLEALVGRLSTWTGSDDDVEGVVGLALNKPAREWTDLDIDTAKLTLAELCERFLRVEQQLRVANRKQGQLAFSVVVVGEKSPESETHTFRVPSTRLAAVHALSERISTMISAEGEEDTSVTLAAIARVGAQLIQKTRDAEKVMQSSMETVLSG
jgi:hypothetical protein